MQCYAFIAVHCSMIGLLKLRLRVYLGSADEQKEGCVELLTDFRGRPGLYARRKLGQPRSKAVQIGAF